MSRSQIHTIRTVSSLRQPINRVFKSLLWISVSALPCSGVDKVGSCPSFTLAGRSCWIWAVLAVRVSPDGSAWFPRLACGEVHRRASKPSICKHSWGSRHAHSHSLLQAQPLKLLWHSSPTITSSPWFSFFNFITNAWFWKLWIRGPWFQSLWSRNSTCLEIKRQAF